MGACWRTMTGGVLAGTSSSAYGPPCPQPPAPLPQTHQRSLRHHTSTQDNQVHQTGSTNRQNLLRAPVTPRCFQVQSYGVYLLCPGNK